MKALEKTAAGRRYGYLPGVKSYPFALASIPITVRIAHQVIDLEAWCGPVKDQGDLGACTAFAGCGNAEYLYRRYRNQDPIFSPLFLYYEERRHDDCLEDGDTGSTGNTSCWVMNHVGLCLEASDPYDPVRMMLPPTPEQQAEAAQHQIGAYHGISNLADLRSCIASGYPALMGFCVYESFESDIVANTGVMPLPNFETEELLGGHEVLVIGFDDNLRKFKVRNSWGAAWGDRGNFWFPYAAVQDTRVFMDARIQHFGKPWGK